MDSGITRSELEVTIFKSLQNVIEAFRCLILVYFVITTARYVRQKSSTIDHCTLATLTFLSLQLLFQIAATLVKYAMLTDWGV